MLGVTLEQKQIPACPSNCFANHYHAVATLAAHVETAIAGISSNWKSLMYGDMRKGLTFLQVTLS